ncbi:hypothetical protein KCU65_g9064, partial [Aureobasidium melanogenum]
MATPITSICALCAINHLLDIPKPICCNAKTEKGLNISCSTCFLDGNQHICFLLDPLGMKYFDRLMALKQNGEAEFSERLEEFQVIIFYHIAILKTACSPIKTWGLKIPVETFAGAPMLVKFGKGIPCEIPDKSDFEEDCSFDTNAASSEVTSVVESATTEVVGPDAQLDIDEPEYFVLEHLTNDKSDSEDEGWVSVSSKDF